MNIRIVRAKEKYGGYMQGDLTNTLNSIFLDITNMISSFLPDDFYIKLIMATAALVLVFGLVNVLYPDKKEETKEKNTI